jgi:hypothetical protein
MTEQQRPDEDVEGHSRAKFDPEASEEDVEGHARALLDDSEEDVEGHRHMLDEGSADDVAGHARRAADDVVPGDEGDDVGGHSGWTRQ